MLHGLRTLTRRWMLATCCTLAVLPLGLHASPLRIATEGAYPPFSYFDAQGQLAGFDVDIAHALCEAMARPCELQTFAWSDLINRLESGQVDLIVASMARTEAREQRVDFSDHYYRSQSIFAGRPERIPDTQPATLAGLRLSTGRDTIQADYLQQHYPDSILLLTDDQEQALALLLEDKADAVLSDTINLLDFLERPEAAAFDFIGGPVEAPELRSRAHIAVAKDNPRLREAVNEALIRIRLSGTYEHINRRYFPFSIY